MSKSSAPVELIDLEDMTESELADFDAHATAWMGDKPVARTRARSGEEKKISVALRLAPAVVAHFRALGPGWQTRINAVLEAAVKASPKKPIAKKSIIKARERKATPNLAARKRA